MEIDFDGNMTQEKDWQTGPMEETEDSIVFQLRLREHDTKIYCEVTLPKVPGLAKTAYEGLAKEKFRSALLSLRICPACASGNITAGTSLSNTHTPVELAGISVTMTGKSFCCKDCGGIFTERYNADGKLVDRTLDPITNARIPKARD